MPFNEDIWLTKHKNPLYLSFEIDVSRFEDSFNHIIMADFDEFIQEFFSFRAGFFQIQAQVLIFAFKIINYDSLSRCQYLIWRE